MSSPTTAVLIPVKAFHDAKVRLAPALDPYARARLARAMAATVVRASGNLPAWVVCDDIQVARWAEDVGAGVVWKPHRGLNAAVTDGVGDLAEQGFSRVVVCHADLPHATDLDQVLVAEGVALVPDRHRDGTNVISVPTGVGFRFSYGPGSFGRHQGEAERLGLELHVVEDPTLSWDIDVPADLQPPVTQPPVTP